MARPRKQEKPLWQLGRDRHKGGQPGKSPVVVQQGADGSVTRLTGRKAEQVTSQLRKPQPSPPPLPASVPFRFRFHLIPFAWLAAAGAAIIAHTKGAQVAGALGLVAVAAGLVLLTRHLPPFPRTRCQFAAAWILAAGLVWDLWGPVRWPSWLALLAWAVLGASWLRHYHWRPVGQETAPAVRVDRARAIWAELADKQKWSAQLGTGKPIANGMQYPVICKGTHTHIGTIISKPQDVAAAYDQPITQAYVEQHPSGIQSRGTFTILERGTLETPRHWAGAGIDRDSGKAVVGRFPDGKDVHETYYSLPRDGISHTIVAGHMGSGKTELLNLGLSISASSGLICPVILDPQMGQALPAWRDHVTYACGAAECMIWLKALHAALFDRSEYLGGLTWVDEHGKRRKGMGFFNPFMQYVDASGQLAKLDLPIIEITIDEAPILLAIKGAVPLVLDIAKLGRKVGFRLRIAAQVPSLAELKAQELRSMLTGSNVFCLRTGDKVTGGYTGVTGDPNLLAKFFANGEKTYGLGYCDTVDGKSATPMRTDLVPDPWEVAETTRICAMDARAAARCAEIIASEDATAAQLGRAADEMAGLKLAVLSQLTEPRTRGDLIAALIQDHPLSEITEAISQLQADRRIADRSGRFVAVL